ncbi:MAG: ABC transporter permease, partial [Thermoguttaceae bacterium]
MSETILETAQELPPDSVRPDSPSSLTPDTCHLTPDSSHLTPPSLRTVIEPTPGWRSINLNELWRYRELLFFLIWRDVKIRYKQTVLGAAWAVIQPLMGMVIFTVFFGRLGRMDKQVDTPYPVFVYAGLLPWLFFANAVTTGGQSLVSQSHLISKIYFPRLFVPLASVGAFLVDFLVSFAVLLCLMVGYRVPFGWGLLAVPLLTVATIVAAVGVGTMLAALTVAYRDFRYVVPFMVQIWMFLSPVVFPFEIIPQKWRLIYCLNPMAGIISGFRSAILGRPFHLDAIAVSVSVALVILVIGSYYFRRV